MGNIVETAIQNKSNSTHTPVTHGRTPLATNVKGVMELTGIGEKGVREAIRNRQLKVLRVGRKLVIPLWAIEEFVRQCAA